MNLNPIFLVYLIDNHLIIKIFLWVCLILLGVYVFLLEGRSIITNVKVRIIAYKLKISKQHVDSAEYLEMRSHLTKSIKAITVIWFVLLVLTTILTITY